jgi:hypothetical protein
MEFPPRKDVLLGSAPGEMTDRSELEYCPKTAVEECERLRKENARLRAMLGVSLEEPITGTASISDTPSNGAIKARTPAEKIALFRSLFRGREDVYAIRWETGGRSGYSPAAVMDWRAIYVAKPEEKRRVARKTRMLLHLTDDVIQPITQRPGVSEILIKRANCNSQPLKVATTSSQGECAIQSEDSAVYQSKASCGTTRRSGSVGRAIEISVM